MARKKKTVEEKKEVILIAEVKVTRKYHDIRLNRLLNVGDVFECSQQRAKELIDAKVAEIVCLKNSL